MKRKGRRGRGKGEDKVNIKVLNALKMFGNDKMTKSANLMYKVESLAEEMFRDFKCFINMKHLMIRMETIKKRR